ncbi:MAG: ribonuclease J [Chloroflexota bacterium]
MEDTLRAILLGGVGEVGKNSTLFEYDGAMVMVDAGVKFPDEGLHGVDLVIPDFGYVADAAEDLVAVLITHGHEDHIGALPYLVRQLRRDEKLPIYGTAITLGLVATKLREHKQLDRVDLIEIQSGDSIELEPFTAQAVRVSHSVPGSVGFAIDSPVGTVFHTGDYKFDRQPVDGLGTDEDLLRQIGDDGLLALFSDCVRVENPGWTGSETTVGEHLEDIIRESAGRVIITTFASNLSRLRQAIVIAHRLGRKVAVAGRSMEQNLKVAAEVGFLDVPQGTIIPLREAQNLAPDKLVLFTTGSQGEPSSVLSRMAMGDHPHVKIIPEDTVVYSAGPIPGNEVTVSQSIDNLYRRGARVIYRAIREGIHVSGHASRDELTHMLGLLRPKFVVPIHGEYRMLVQYGDLAVASGVPRDNVVIADIGEVIEFTPDSAEKNGSVKSGAVLIDGLTIGDVTRVVLRDRTRLATDGVLIASVVVDRESGDIIGGPDLLSRGVVDPEQDQILPEARDHLLDVLESVHHHSPTQAFLTGKIRETLSAFVYERGRRRPMILPIVTEV